MTFLTPTILWGLLAASLPIIIHLFSKRRKKTILFSTLYFMKKLEFETIRSLKIKQWILVILRVLAILLLVLMFARPVKKGIVPAWMAAEQESRVVIIIDNSASMNQQFEELSFLDMAKQSVPTIVESFKGQTFIDIYQTNPIRQVFSGRKKGTELVQSTQLINQSVSADNLWITVDSVLKNIEATEPNKECFIISDFAQAPGHDLSFNHSDRIESNSKWRFYCINMPEIRNNLSIRDVNVLSQIRLPNHLLKINTTVTNDGISEKRNIPVELYLDNDRMGQVISTFQNQKSKDFSFQAYPGKSGIINGKMEIPEDDYEFDNIWTFEIPIPDQIKCTIIGNSNAEIFLLETALKSIDNNSGFLLIEKKIIKDLNRLYLDDTDVLLLYDPGLITQKGIDDIKAYLKRGGNIIWFCGERQMENKALFNELNLPEITSKHAVTDKSYYPVHISNENEPIFSDLNLRDFESELPQIFQYLGMKLNRHDKPILIVNRQDPLLIQSSINKGQVFIFSTLMDLAWNDLPVRGLVVPLLHRILLLSATDETNSDPVYIDEEKIISLDRETINKKWELITPKGKSIILIPNFNTETLIITQTEELGTYDIMVDGSYFTSFSTRLNPGEYPSKKIDPEFIETKLQPNAVNWLSTGFPLAGQLESIRYGKSLWRYFLFGAIIILLIESIIGRTQPTDLKRKSSS